MQLRSHWVFGLAVWLVQGSATPSLAGTGEPVDGVATVFHVPPSAWTGGRDQRLEARIERDWQLARVWVGVRRLGDADPYTEIEMRRAADNRFAAVLPAHLVQPPGLEYYIASQSVGGGPQRVHFAQPADPQRVLVRGETDETRLSERLARHDGRRSRLSLTGELTRYGLSLVEPPGSEPRTTEAGSDAFWVTRLAYTHRLFDTLYDIHFGVALLRGRAATFIDDQGNSVPVAGEPGAPRPGLNYGYGGVTLEAHRFFSLSTDVLLGVSERGFAAGIGLLLRFGRIEGTRFETGVELLKDVGNLGYFRFAWDTVPRVPMALTVELDDRPGGQNNPLGTRLVYDLGVEATPQLTIGLRGGYAARADGTEAGFVAGLSTTVEF